MKTDNIKNALNQEFAGARLNEAGLRFLFENSGNFIVLTDLAGRITYANKFAQRLFGVSGTDWIGKEPASFVDPENSLKISKMFKNLIAYPGKSQRETLNFTTLEGDKILLDVGAHNLMDIEDVGYLVLDGRDITRQEKIENDLRISGELFESAFQSNNAMCSITDLETGIFLDVNQVWLDTLGHSREETIGKRGVDLNIWSSEEMRDQVIKKLMQDRFLRGFVAEISKKNGDKFTVEINAQILKIGETEKLYFSSTDITERQKNAKAIRDSEERFRDLIEYSTDWFWETDENLIFTVVSDSAPPFGQSDRNRVIGKNVEAYFSIFGQRDLTKKILKIMGARKPFRNLHHTYISPTKGIRHLSYSGKPIFDGTGDFVGYRGTGSDETTVVEAELKREAAEDKLRQAQKMEAVGQLTGGIAHDFNNLLLIILGNAELIDDSLPAEDVNKKPMDAIIRAANNGAELTQSLLAYSRKQFLSPKNIRLDRQLEKMIEMLPRTLGATIQIKALSPDELWTCFADPGQVENVLLNLANNARDAMPGGGSLTIEFTNKHLVNEQIGFENQTVTGDFVTMSVVDSGTGMSIETLQHIFEPFYTTKEIGKGTGLGLSMVYGFAEQSNGYVTVSSKLGVGTTVNLYLPRTQE